MQTSNFAKSLWRWTTRKSQIFWLNVAVIGSCGNVIHPDQATTEEFGRDRFVQLAISCLVCWKFPVRALTKNLSHTVLVVETENVINSCPLCVDTLSDPNSLKPISPMTLLTQKSNAVYPLPVTFESPTYSAVSTGVECNTLSTSFGNVDTMNTWIPCKNVQNGNMNSKLPTLMTLSYWQTPGQGISGIWPEFQRYSQTKWARSELWKLNWRTRQNGQWLK